MNLEMFVTSIVVGLVTGGSISFAVADGGYGRVSDVILGVAGSGAASTCAAALGALSGDGIGTIAVASFIGAASTIVLQRKISPSRTAQPNRDETPK